ncbi:hypothetical protein CFIMG_002727RAa [Ceratocystis fimbriata CBS 114723]|uniref:Uncharacterized protein n=1 Tax=Ceratocystis fimbriata CBS 114723 TaxID=1035309 RepID=A0A2C5X2V0_9PEZI|nr:hypothetical protein CFIMG_002727RAa [Ceratocystis fimbriata CBS 114723]
MPSRKFQEGHRITRSKTSTNTNTAITLAVEISAVPSIFHWLRALPSKAKDFVDPSTMQMPLDPLGARDFSGSNSSSSTERPLSPLYSHKPFLDRIAPYLNPSRRQRLQRYRRVSAKSRTESRKTSHPPTQPINAAEKYKAPQKKESLVKDPLFLR